MLRNFSAAALLACCPAAQSAGPYITDAAAIAAPGACQLEAWQRWSRGHGHETYALPACTFGGRLELTLGANQLEDRAGAEARHLLLQGKMIFRDFAAHGLGFGAAAGGVWREETAPGQEHFSQAYAYVPVTLLAQNTLVHVNLGVLHSEDAGRQFATWAGGVETALSERFAMNAEFYGDHHSEPSAQAGVTFYWLPDRLTVFALAGAQHHDAAARWATLGFALSGSLFPP